MSSAQPFIPQDKFSYKFHLIYLALLSTKKKGAFRKHPWSRGLNDLNVLGVYIVSSRFSRVVDEELLS